MAKNFYVYKNLSEFVKLLHTLHEIANGIGTFFAYLKPKHSNKSITFKGHLFVFFVYEALNVRAVYMDFQLALYRRFCEFP